MDNEKLNQQINFILEIDQLKSIFRRSCLLGTDRQENSAEHSWHLAVMAIILAEYAEEKVDILKVIKMVLVHDIVEIQAGDVFCYDEVGNQTKLENEEKAAAATFGLLPAKQINIMLDIWREFEERETAESKYAHALDRLMPLLHNYHGKGKVWLENGIIKDQVINRNKPIQDSSPALWEYAQSIIQDAVDKGYLPTE